MHLFHLPMEKSHATTIYITFDTICWRIMCWLVEIVMRLLVDLSGMSVNHSPNNTIISYAQSCDHRRVAYQNPLKYQNL